MIDFYIVEGKPAPLKTDVAARNGFRVATDVEIGAAARASLPGRRREAVRGARPRKPCPRCPKGSPPADVATVRWLGIRWIGVPFPFRIRLRSPIYIARAEGCGCIAALKRWVESRRLRRFARRR